MDCLIMKAAAKINWSLAILGRREDGYHLLQMVMQKISLFDKLSLSLNEQDSLAFQGSLPDNQENLALKAWLLLKKELGLSDCLKITLEKEIPIGGGLAGGSTDAAAVLKGANQLLNLGLTLEDLQEIGVKLGADIPFCLMEYPALVEGIGEKTSSLKAFPVYHLVLIYPGIGVSTPWAFKAYDKLAQNPVKIDNKMMIDALTAGDINLIKQNMKNHLEDVVISEYPIIGQVKQALKGLGLFPLMSGSGSCVFGLAENEKQAIQAAEELNGRWPLVKKLETI